MISNDLLVLDFLFCKLVLNRKFTCMSYFTKFFNLFNCEFVRFVSTEISIFIDQGLVVKNFYSWKLVTKLS